MYDSANVPVVVPPPGIVAGVVKAKPPVTLATPPLKVELANDCPLTILVAVG